MLGAMRAMLSRPFLLYVVLEGAAVALTALMPGTPYYADTGTGSLGSALIFDLVLAFGLLRRSLLAWGLIVFLDVVWVGFVGATVVTDFGSPTINVKAVLVIALVVGQLVLLFSSGLQPVRGRRRRLSVG